MAGAAVTGAGVVLFFLRRPMLTVLALLALFTVGAMVTSELLSRSSSPERLPAQSPDSRVATYRLPGPTESLSAAQAAPVHRALHALDRACKHPERGTHALRGPLRIIETFATKHPTAGFAIDDETGTTLAMLIVVRSELEGCAPALLPRVNALIPERYRS